MPIGIGAATLIAGLGSAGAAAGAGIYGAHKQASSANKAADLEAKGSAQQLAFLQQQEQQRRAEHARTEALNLDQYTQQQARVAPFRQTGTQAVTTLGQMLRPGSGAAFLPPPTEGRSLRDALGGR